jgi:NAD-dependent SIR2 family protein deacetylase
MEQTMTDSVNNALARAAQWLREADGLLITAGAGMGVDSGLPDFRGTQGFWRAYPALKAEGVRFEVIANPAAFHRDPTRAWGFYGHRLNLYRKTVPHRGFDILRKWGEQMEHGTFVFTSNVDGQFQTARFAESGIAECHGTLHVLQCWGRQCGSHLWPADELEPEVDEANCRLLSPLPRCPGCGAVARPNVLMFDDYSFVDTRTDQQEMRLEGWFADVRAPVVIELGAGRAIPTVRNFSVRHGPRVIRINPRESAIDPRQGIGIAGNALDVLGRLDAHMIEQRREEF